MEKAQQQSVLITGSNSGFGELFAKTLAQAGYYVFATMRGTNGRNQEAAAGLTQWARDGGLKLDVLDLDVTDDASVAAAIAEALSRAGKLDVVINNAGASSSGPLEAFTIDEMQSLFNVNVFGQIRVAKAVLPSMRRQRAGLIIHISSTLGRVHSAGGLYPSTKWALEGLTETLHHQVKPFGVDVVLLEPGSYPTPHGNKSLKASDDSIAEEYAPYQAPPRPGPHPLPESANQEVADAVQRLIEMPAGTRPLRTVVGTIWTKGVAQYNEAYDQTREKLLEAAGWMNSATPAAQPSTAGR